MGYILIQSRQDELKINHSNRLTDSADQDDELASFMPGDLIIFTLNIDRDTAEKISMKNLPGVTFQQKLSSAESEPVNFEVNINFRIIKRVHNLSRDWMSQNNMGFRSSGTTIWAEAATDEGEDLFNKLQNQFDVNLAQNLYEQ